MSGVIAVGLVDLLVNDLFSVRAGIWGAALTAFSPFLIWYSRDATDYSWLIAVSLGSFYLLVRSLKKGGSLNWALYCIVTFVALFSHYYAVFLFIAEIAFFIIISKHRKQIRPWLICQAILLLALFPWVLLLSSSKSYSSEQYLNYTTPSITSVFSGIGTAPIVFVRGYVGLIGSGSSALFLTSSQGLILAVFALVVLALLFLPSIKRSLLNREYLAFTTLTFLLIALPVVSILSQGGYVAGRYYAFAAPFFILWLAIFITAVPRRVGFVFGGLLVLLLLFFYLIELRGTPRENWKDLMNTMAAEGRSGDQFLCFPLHHCVMAQDYYTGADLQVRGGVVVKTDRVRMDHSEFVWNGYKTSFDGN